MPASAKASRAKNQRSKHAGLTKGSTGIGSNGTIKRCVLKQESTDRLQKRTYVRTQLAIAKPACYCWRRIRKKVKVKKPGSYDRIATEEEKRETEPIKVTVRANVSQRIRERNAINPRIKRRKLKKTVRNHEC